jgi:hypothetical protein
VIDRLSRDNLAERLRQLASGSITNFAFEQREIGSSRDAAIHAIEFRLAWPHYDDFVEHRLDGGFRLTDGQRRDFARSVLFLKSDLEYRWPERSLPTAIKNYLGRLLSYGRWMPSYTDGDLSVWPFYTKEEYRLCLKTPPYLRGDVERTNNS